MQTINNVIAQIIKAENPLYHPSELEYISLWGFLGLFGNVGIVIPITHYL